ncbi:MAG: hypothetical protein E7409_02535 [Ruminococcaceae bacterium]|nr:hypothetical protein [Oscillospiraceae bacterium]
MNRVKTVISAFDGCGEMEVTLRRPSVLSMARAGKIPNPLLGAVAKLFDFAGAGASEPSLSEIGETVHVIAQEALVEPAYEQVKEALTDCQLMEIYHFVKGGTAALACFRRLGKLFSGTAGVRADRQGDE